MNRQDLFLEESLESSGRVSEITGDLLLKTTEVIQNLSTSVFRTNTRTSGTDTHESRSSFYTIELRKDSIMQNMTFDSNFLIAVNLPNPLQQSSQLANEMVE